MNLSTEEISEVELSASKAAQEYEVFKRETCKLPDFIAANACIDFLRGVEWLLNYQKENPQARDSVKNGGDEG